MRPVQSPIGDHQWKSAVHDFQRSICDENGALNIFIGDRRLVIAHVKSEA
jgi:hypothetical protein